jgi:hypothetical protein
MAAYNRRDLFAHWVRKDEPARRPCQHACCRGMRPHPENYPVTKRNAYLRWSSDAELTRFYGQHQGDTQDDQRYRDQILAEMQIRDERDERRAAAEERRTARASARRQERALMVESEWLAAETETRGNMLNRRGREARVDERSLFTGPESRARKYASEELLAYWEHHPRPTQAFYEGYDTRVGYGRQVGVRKRITSEEAYWRDQYERAEAGAA